MVSTTLRWVKRCAEYRLKNEADLVPRGTRGIYVLFRHRPIKDRYDVVYVGLSRAGIRARLRAHRRKKADLWSHFSLFEVQEAVSDAEIGELEGLFRQIYRRDSRANRLNVQKTHGPIKATRQDDLASWHRS